MGLRQTLDALDDCEIVGEAEDGLSAIGLAKNLQPDLMLLDAAMPLARGIEVLAEVRRWSPKTKVAVITGFTAGSLLADWLNAGVEALFLKDTPSEEFCEGIRIVLEGGNFISRSAAKRIEANQSTIDLTAREREVLSLIATGHMNTAIADRLHISPKTVEKHRASLMAKLGVNSVSGLLTHALREGLLDEHRQL